MNLMVVTLFAGFHVLHVVHVPLSWFSNVNEGVVWLSIDPDPFFLTKISRTHFSV